MVCNGEEYEALGFLELGQLSLLPYTTGIEPDTYIEVLFAVLGIVQTGHV